MLEEEEEEEEAMQERMRDMAVQAGAQRVAQRPWISVRATRCGS